MIHTRSSTDALAQRADVISPGTGIRHWGTVFFGPRSSAARAPGPQATMSDLNPGESILPHFHGVSMFQLFVDGSGTIGNRGQELKALTIQFKDHHTAYGPIVAGPNGLSFVALRIFTGNSEPVYLDKPGYRERLRPSKRRNVTTDPVIFSVDPVMEHREQAQWETLLEDPADGMRAQVVRLGAGKAVQGPDPRAAGVGVAARFEDEHRAPFPHHEAVTLAVEGARGAGGMVAAAREGTEVVEGGKAGRAEDVAATGQTDIDKPCGDPAAGQGQRVAARGTGRRDGDCRPLDAEPGGDPVDKARGPVGREDLPSAGKEIGFPALELLGADAEDEADAPPGHRASPGAEVAEPGVGRGRARGCQADLAEPVEGVV